MKTQFIFITCLLLMVFSCRKSSTTKEINQDSSSPSITINGPAELTIPSGIYSPDPIDFLNQEVKLPLVLAIAISLTISIRISWALSPFLEVLLSGKLKDLLRSLFL